MPMNGRLAPHRPLPEMRGDWLAYLAFLVVVALAPQAWGQACFADLGNGTVLDSCTGRQWEKKVGTAGVLVPCAFQTCSQNPHEVTNSYRWSVGDPWGPTGELWTVFLYRLNNTCANDYTIDCAAAGDVACASVGGACGFAGHRDWQIPSIGDLQSIADCSFASDPCAACIDPIFGPVGGTLSGECDRAHTTRDTRAANPQDHYLVGFNNGGGVFFNWKLFHLPARAIRYLPIEPTSTTTSSTTTTTSTSETTSSTTTGTTSSSTTSTSSTTTTSSSTTTTMPSVACGNGVVEVGETCDLGPETATGGNCPATSSCDDCTRSCSHDCKLMGRCTNGTSVGNCCTTTADCAPGEGCCGDGVTQLPEQCDDGNHSGGDTCTPQCQTDTGPPLTCCPRGAEIAGATVLPKKKVRLTHLGSAPNDDMLKSVGEAILLPGQEIHPCTEGVTYCLEGPSGILYGPNPPKSGQPQVAGGQMQVPCVDTATPRRLKARYKDRGRPPTGSDPDGVKQLDLKNVPSQPNKLKFKLLLRDVDLAAASGVSTTLRQTIVVGDTCLVLKLVCTPAGTSTAICVPSP
jgi:cysteine-rich repeat protein